MASQQKTVTATADFVLTSTSIPIDATRIRSVSVFNLTTGSLEASAFVQIGLMAGGNAQGNRITIIASGYVGEINAISWHGDFTGDAQMFVYANIRSATADQFRLAILGEPI